MVLAGTEVDIKANGELDYSDSILQTLDIVVASVHSSLNQNKEEMTDRIIKAIENENVDIIGHPTGRIIHRRYEVKLDFDKVFSAAKKHNKFLEINANIERLDLNDVHIKDAIDKGVKLVINTDAHSVDSLDYIKLGIGQSRRGWAKKSDIINTLSYNEFKKILN